MALPANRKQLHRRFQLGDKVRRTTSGCVNNIGTVIRKQPLDACTDGTYRWPFANEKAVWVAWDNGTIGWDHQCYLEHIPVQVDTT